ncbi:MAG: rubredoxin [Syntrophus sp. (in: bacteria)]|nr:rubredoxin [Syntrophus sp. (in: bacteria)]
MGKYKCSNCNYIYDSERGYKKYGIPPGTDFKDVANDWRCPACGEGKSRYVPYTDRPFPGPGPSLSKE